MLLTLDPNDDEKEQALRMVVERRAERNIRQAFNGMLDTLYPGGYEEWAEPQQAANRALEHFRADQALYDALNRALLEAADLGVNVAIDQYERIGFGFAWDLVNTRARDWAREYAGTLIRQIDDTSQTFVRQTVSRWIGNGEPLEQLVRDLTPMFGERRASQIASTEVTRSFANANLLAYKESGVTNEVEWRTANDGERVCPICGVRHGKRAPMENPQIDGKTIPAHPACRCWWVPVVSDS